MDIAFPLLTYIVFLPLVGGILAYAVGASVRLAKWVAMVTSLVVLGLSTVLLVGIAWPASAGGLFSLPRTDIAGTNPLSTQTYYGMERVLWVSVGGFTIHYALGADGLSVVLVFLNALLTPLALAISWDEHHRVSEMFAMFLLMETTVSGVFLSLDLFQFLIFWEVGLVPMYFLIAVWGGPRKRYAAMKFFLYTFLASVPLLLSIFAFVFYSGTFDMTAIIQRLPIGPGAIGDLMFLAMLVGFGTKLPTFPLHTWLPDAHVEAPTGGSVILAGILLKLGGYGLIRFNVQMIPFAAQDMYWVLVLVGTVSILYGSIVCLAQDDLKRMVALSSVSHMGFVTLGIAAGVYGYVHAPAGSSLQAGAALGFMGAIFVMFAHGLISPAMFMVSGSLGHKLGTRNISELGGITKVAPRFGTFFMISFMASVGLPGLVGFAAEYTVFAGVYAAFGLFVFIPILSVVFTAAYYIFAMQRALFGPLNPKWEHMKDLENFEVAPLSVLAATFAVFGILPLLIYQILAPWVTTLLRGVF